MRKKKCRIILLCLVTVLLTAILCCYLLVCINAKGKTFNDVQDIPFNEVGLLLGTSPVTSNGEHNYYFDERIDYSNNGGCNELIAMRDSLIKQEVPDSLISLDYQGTRTLHSITKLKDLGSITIISQKYHNERAIYLAEHYGLQAVAYNAAMPNIAKKKIRNISREFLARVKLFIYLVSSE